jgi:hypothetical protein
VIPSGAAPLQPAVRLTVELNPSTDESTILADCDTPSVNDATAGEDCGMELIEKSGAATGASTDGAPAIVTTISDEWDTTPSVAVTTSV